MTNIDTLIKENRTNHYKLLTIVGNNKSRIDRLVAYLKSKDWTVYDVEEKVLEITDNMPTDKIRLRIGTELKKWIKTSLILLWIYLNPNINPFRLSVAMGQENRIC
jgi:hypothetical protein